MYVVWSTVSAGLQNWLLGPPVTLAAHFNVTKAYPPNYLMTVPGGCNYHQVGRPWSPLRISDLMHPPQNWIAAQGCFWRFDGANGGTGPLGGVDPNGTIMAASPVLSYPPDILTLDPAWNSCGSDAYNWGDYDPPRALTPATATVLTSLAIARVLSSVVGPLGPPDPISKPAPTFHESVTALPGAHIPTGAPASMTVTKTTAPQPTRVGPPGDPSAGTVAETGDIGTNPFSVIVGPLPGAPYVEAPNHHSASVGPIAIATVGSRLAYVLPQGDVSVDGVIVSGGGPATTVDDIRVSVDAHAVYVGSSTIAKPSPLSGMGPAPSVIDGQKLRIDGDGRIVLGGKTLPPDHQTVVDGSSISVGMDCIVVDGNSYALPSTEGLGYGQPSADNPLEATNLPNANDPPAISEQQIEAGPNGAIVIGGSTVSEGQQRTVDGTHISVGPSNIIVGSSTYDKPTITDSAASDPSSYWDIVVGGKTVNLPVLPTGVFQGLASLEDWPVPDIPAGFQTTISGTPLSIGPSIIVVGKSTYAPPLHNTDLAVSLATNGVIVIDGKTLTEGVQSTISGTVVSVGGSIVVVGTKTYELPLPTDPAASLASNGAVVIDGVTLTRGAQTTISGTAVSVGSSFIVIQGKTYALPEPTKAPEAAGPAIGAIIASMYGYSPPNANAMTPTSGAVLPSGSFEGSGNSTPSLTLFTGAARKIGFDPRLLTVTTGLSICVGALALLS